MAEVVVGQAEFFGAEEECGGSGGKLAQDKARAVFEAAEGMLQFPVSNRSRADDQLAVGYRGGDRWAFFGALEQGGGPHRGAGLSESEVVGVDDPQAREAEVGHRSGRRADIERIAGLHQDDAKIVFPVGCDPSMVPCHNGVNQRGAKAPT